jgi:hypothetical protein
MDEFDENVSLDALTAGADYITRGDHTLVIHYARPTDRDDAYRMLRNVTLLPEDEVDRLCIDCADGRTVAGSDSLRCSDHHMEYMRSATMPRRALQDEARATWTAADQRDKEWGC